MTSAKVIMMDKGSSSKGEGATSSSFQQAINRSKVRHAPTLERAQLLIPSEDVMSKIYSSFGVMPCDQDELYGHGYHLIKHHYDALKANLSTFALKLSLDQIVASLVSNAIRSGEFYEKKRSYAQDQSSKLRNFHRDEDRLGVDDSENHAARARRIAAEKAAEAYSILKIAEGACAGYLETMGSEWVAYNTSSHQNVSKTAAMAESEALGF